MLKNEKGYEEAVISNIDKIHKNVKLPKDHTNYLKKLKNEYKFEPKVIYDIGSCVLHWTVEADTIWPNSQIYLFDAFSPLEQLYKKNKYKYNIGVLSDKDDKIVKFYQNDFKIGGNSYYRERFYSAIFPKDNYIEKVTSKLDTVVKNNNFNYPNLIKMDVQGSELDIIKGSKECLKTCEYLIVELQDVEYNDGAPLAHVTIDYLDSIGFKCIARKFSDNGPDADYCFKNINQ